jgi:O-antigen ligase
MLEPLKSRAYLAWPVYGLCAFLPLSIVGISIFKLLVLLTGCGVLVLALFEKKQIANVRTLSITLTIALLALLAISLGYTSATDREALDALGKYAKILLIPAVALLLRDKEQALNALCFYLATQSFVVISSWLLFIGIHLPWVANDRNALGVVYSSYLDQAILTAGFAVLSWHLRSCFANKWLQRSAYVLTILAALNLVFVLQGRSGQVCLIAAIGLAVWWAMPSKLRPLAIASPFLAFGLAMLLSPQFNQRNVAVITEIKGFQSQPAQYKDTSSGERLNFWSKSIQAIGEKPILGHGVGAWQQQYIRLENGKPSERTANVRNPHQEYLLTGVQLGLVGLLMLIAWQLSFALEAKKFTPIAKQTTLSLLLVFVVACSFNSAIYDAVVGDYFCTLLAVMMCFGRLSSGKLTTS